MTEYDPEDEVQGLPRGWQRPGRVQQLKAWDALAPERRADLEQLQREGWKEWKLFDKLDEDEPEASRWVELVLLPPDPRQAAPELIGRWPLKVELDEHARVRAIIKEHWPDA